MSAPQCLLRCGALSIDSLLFLTTNERYLRALANSEQRTKRFTVGLSRAIDLLDQLREAAI